MMAYMSVLVMMMALVVDIHDGSLTAGMSVLVMMMAAAVDTHLPLITIKERSCLTCFVLLQTHSWNKLTRVVYQYHITNQGIPRGQIN